MCHFLFLQDVLKEFLFDCQLRQLSFRTIKSYKNGNLAFLRYLENEFSCTELEDLNYKMIQQYIKFMSNKGLKESYINNQIKLMRAFFNYCMQESYINRNPMDKIHWQKEIKPLIETFSDEEVVKMVNFYGTTKYLDIRNKLIMIIFFDTGIRNQELCDLKLEDIHQTFLLIHGKGKKIRHVPITVMINKYLIKYLRVRECYIKDKIGYEKEYLFLSQKGRKLTTNTTERIVLLASKGCNVRSHIRSSPHTCRHYYAQAQLKNGCDIYTLSKLLGHTNIAITKRYLESLEDEEVLQIGNRSSPLTNM